jgi:protein O-GlcNAc transferase
MNIQLQSLLQQAIKAFQSGNFKKAEEALQYFLNIKPTEFDALHLLAIVYASQNKHDTAIEWYKKALDIISDDASALSNYASSLSAIGRNQEALNIFNNAIKINSSNSVFFYNIANTLCELERYEEALSFYGQSIQLDPQYFQAYNNYGKALYDLKRYSDSLIYYDHALLINPFYLDCIINKGVTLNQLKRYDEALVHYDQAITLKPDYAEGWSNKGNTLHELKRYDEALVHYDQAITLKPDYAEGWSNKGNTLHELKRYDEALVHYDQALSIKPDINWMPGNLLHAGMKICSWSSLAESLEKISIKVAANEKVAQPFPLLALSDDTLLHKKSSEIYVQSKYPFNPILGPILKRAQDQKIRVGYFSADFHNHATGYLMAELFELHDRSQFELVGFSFGPTTNDEMSQRLQKSFDQFFEVGKKSDTEVVMLSRALNIDIAVDLKGFTQNARTGIFAHQAAPIQVNYLGYPGTMGADYIDYIIADKTLIPPRSRKFYSEKVAYLPDSYQVNDRKRLISERKFTRQELRLPEDSFVFCCFNNNYKILPAIFTSWMRILKAVDRGVLWLLQDNRWVAENLKKEAEKQGISTDRLVFAERLLLPEHLSRHRQADLFLDTFPYNAHTTTSDALWAGLPVLTLMGQSFASRVAASLLNAIGLPELITNTQEQYEALAIELAANPQKLADIKLKLASNRLTTPLFDTPLFTKNLEAAYIQMYEHYRTDLEPDHIVIT